MMMKLRKGERRMTSKFAEIKRVDEFKFIGVIEIENKSFRSIVEAQYRGQAVRKLMRIAQKNKGHLNVSTIHVI